ncbi:hypothetical protein [Ferrimonas sp. YFM]|uniref:hypothetical protein n=1 Tax=Ferrimonas sp. YFM TaxID=3028878 RepID=UPI002573AE2C|nr:hypothetical protein [Ferrimonas sp. YFM]BDY06421.1 hypothetical protein F0521_34620 [Ferrimonas sp. YFM]
MKPILIALTITGLTACSGIRVTTNAGPYLESRVLAHDVEEYSREELERHQYRFLGTVDTEACQEERTDSAPSEKGLKNVLRSEVAKLGGNAISYNGCESKRDYYGCRIWLRCEALGYEVQD